MYRPSGPQRNPAATAKARPGNRERGEMLGRAGRRRRSPRPPPGRPARRGPRAKSFPARAAAPEPPRLAPYRGSPALRRRTGRTGVEAFRTLRRSIAVPSRHSSSRDAATALNREEGVNAPLAEQGLNPRGRRALPAGLLIIWAVGPFCTSLVQRRLPGGGSEALSDGARSMAAIPTRPREPPTRILARLASVLRHIGPRRRKRRLANKGVSEP